MRKEQRYTRLKKILSDNKIRISHQRILVLDYLYTHKTHPTADTIFKDLKKNDPILSQATVYNTLNVLVDKNIIRELDFNEKSKRYDFDLEGKAHFICDKCHNVYDIENCNIKTDLGNEYKVNQVQVVYRGICPDCLKENNNQ